MIAKNVRVNREPANPTARIVLLYLLATTLISCLPIGKGPLFLLFAELFVSSLRDTFLFALLVSSALFYGYLLVQFLGIKTAGRLEIILISAGLGIGLESLFIFALGFINLFYAGLSFGLTIIFSIPALMFLIWKCGKNIAILRITLSKSPDAHIHRFLLYAMSIFTFLQLLVAYLPPVGYDALEYHFGGPTYYVQIHKLGYLWGNAYAAFPANMEMLNTWGMLLHNEIIGKLFIWFVGLLTTWAIYYTGKKHFSSLTGAMAGSMFAALPMLVKLNLQGNIDIAMACFSVFSFLSFLNWEKEKRNSDLVLCGIFSGLALGCKYIIITLNVLPLLILIFFYQKVENKKLSTLFLFCISSFIVFVPWLLKNFFLTGNPVFPLAYSFLGGYEWNNFVSHKFVEAHAPVLDFIHLLNDHKGLFLPISSAPYTLIPILFLPVLFLINKSSYVWKPLLIYLGISYLGWVFTHHVDRFLIPVFPFLCLAVSIVLASGLENIYNATGKGGYRGLLALLGISCILLNGAYQFFTCQNIFDTTAKNAKVTLVKIEGKPDQLSFGYGGPFTKEFHWKFPFQISWQKQFLQQNVSTYPIIEYINTQLPANTQLLFFAEARRTYLQRSALINTVFDPIIFLEMAKYANTPEELKALFQEAHINYIFDNPYELKRLTDFYGAYISPDTDPSKVQLMTDFLQTQTQEIYHFQGMKIYQIK